MSDDKKLDIPSAVDDEGKRDFIFIATGAAAAAGAVSLGLAPGSTDGQGS